MLDIVCFAFDVNYDNSLTLLARNSAVQVALIAGHDEPSSLKRKNTGYRIRRIKPRQAANAHDDCSNLVMIDVVMDGDSDRAHGSIETTIAGYTVKEPCLPYSLRSLFSLANVVALIEL